MSYAILSPKEDKVILPLFIFVPYDDYYVDSIALIDLVSGKQDILITNIKPEEELYPTQWIDENHVLISNVNPVYNSDDKTERRGFYRVRRQENDQSQYQCNSPPLFLAVL